MLMSHFEEPKLSDDEEPPTEQDKRKKLVGLTQTQTNNFAGIAVFIPAQQSSSVCPLMAKLVPFYSFMQFGNHKTRLKTFSKNKEVFISVKYGDIEHIL